MTLIDCDLDHACAIRDIFNEVICNSKALYDYKERSLEEVVTWIQKKHQEQLPLLGLVNDNQHLVGFTSYGPFRHFPAYKYSAEHCLYIDVNFRGQKLGQRLLKEICLKAEENNIRTLIGAIDSGNRHSLSMHKKAGFIECGIIKDVGFKFNEWLDLVFVQKTLRGPLDPDDG